jgi:hypothetical protein
VALLNCVIRDIEKLEKRFVGKKFKNLEIDQKFTVVGLCESSGLALLQYDDGTAYDEMVLPNIVTEKEANELRVSESGLDDGKYFPLDEDVPELSEACNEENHSWDIFPSEFKESENWFEDEGDYCNEVRCEDCGLSGDVVISFLGHNTPMLCIECNSDVLPSDNYSYYGDQVLCEDCNI